jgi:hypothetical protein
MKSEVELGAWITAAYKVLSKYSIDQPALDPLEAIVTGGRAADFFSATRSLGTIGHKKFEAHRKLAKLKLSAAREVLKVAEKLGFVDARWAKDPAVLIDKYAFKVDSKEAVLDATGAIFPHLNPTSVARAVLEAMSLTLYMPQGRETVRNHLASKGFGDEDVDYTVRLITELGLVGSTQETEGGQIILFNPYAFEANAEEAFKVLESLNDSQRQRAQDILQHVRDNPGVPLPAGTDQKVLAILIKVGLIDYSKITTATRTKGVYFATAPYIWGVFDKSAGKQLSTDLIDDAKLFLNSLRYGQYFSHPGRGKIIKPAWIVNALLRDGAIGLVTPATAIGEDYPLALSRGIVNVVESRVYSGRYSMELLKRDVAATVGELLEQRTILPTGKVPTAEEVERAGQFVSPGAVRVESELPPALKKYQDELIFGLRTMRKRS